MINNAKTIDFAIYFDKTMPICGNFFKKNSTEMYTYC